MLVSGRLLESRGAVIPGLSAAGLARAAVRGAWSLERWPSEPLPWAAKPMLGAAHRGSLPPRPVNAGPTSRCSRARS
jgi:hypothetical protein